VVVGLVAVAGIAVSAWLATRPGAQEAQEGMVRWLNQPPPPLNALFALVNPLLRPLPLAVVTVLLLGWILVTARSIAARLEILRAALVSVLLAEIIAQVLKRLASQARPLAVMPNLDTHGYPRDPAGNAYPSAHTAFVVAVACALWPWLRPTQRVVAVVLVVLIPLNRVYIGAHWPIDLVGGAAVGVLAATFTWLIAARWPITSTTRPHHNAGTTPDTAQRHQPRPPTFLQTRPGRERTHFGQMTHDYIEHCTLVVRPGRSARQGHTGAVMRLAGASPADHPWSVAVERAGVLTPAAASNLALDVRCRRRGCGHGRPDLTCAARRVPEAIHAPVSSPMGWLACTTRRPNRGPDMCRAARGRGGRWQLSRAGGDVLAEKVARASCAAPLGDDVYRPPTVTTCTVG
jgi:undecaprenyl-diphosphatase